MIEILNMVKSFQIEIILGLVISTLILLVLNIISRLKISKITDKYNKLVQGADKVNIENLLLQIGEEVDNLGSSMEIAKRDIKSLEDKLSFAIQKVDIIRYNAFDEMGSEQSFSVAFLDEHNTGMILTSIFGRDYSSSFIKPVEKGISKYNLSEEEAKVLSRLVG